MVFSSNNLEQQLLESAAGQAVYDSLIQANVNISTVSIELVKQMLVAECQFRKLLGAVECSNVHAVC
jgi:hypothetical protein